MFSKDAQQELIDKVDKWVKSKPGDLSKKEGLKRIPKEDVYVEKTIDGVIDSGKIITRKALHAFYDEANNITWEDYFKGKILNFIEDSPHLYDITSV